jgi:hypothetical protein
LAVEVIKKTACKLRGYCSRGADARRPLIIILALIILFIQLNLFAGSITLGGGIDNFAYDYYENDTPNIFNTPYYMPIINAAVQGEFTTSAYYTIGFELDNVLRYFLYGKTVFNLWAFRLGAGTFLSLFTEGEEPHIPGFFGSVGIELPGGLSLYAEYGLNAFTDLTLLGNTNLNFGNVNLTIWLPNVVMRLNMVRKSFAQARSVFYTIRNTSLRYEALLDIYAKAMPLIFTLGGGYKTFEKSLEAGPGYTGNPRSASMELFFGTVGFDFELSQDFHILLNLEAAPPIVEGFFFSAFLGFRIVSQNW